MLWIGCSFGGSFDDREVSVYHPFFSVRISIFLDKVTGRGSHHVRDKEASLDRKDRDTAMDEIGMTAYDESATARNKEAFLTDNGVGGWRRRGDGHLDTIIDVCCRIWTQSLIYVAASGPMATPMDGRTFCKAVRVVGRERLNTVSVTCSGSVSDRKAAVAIWMICSMMTSCATCHLEARFRWRSPQGCAGDIRGRACRHWWYGRCRTQPSKQYVGR